MCGECCRRIGCVNLLPEFQGENGSCIHLGADNRCDIYAERPLLCRVDEIYEVFFASEMTLEVFYEENKKCCAAFRKNMNIL
jgi:Fe-S-cluster containining protein